MNEQISRLMDGDADESEVERVCHGCATGPLMETWVCYHVIGDVLRGALQYLMTWEGIPCVYYGTEQISAGGVDPKNREDMFLGNQALGYAPWSTDNDTFTMVQALIQIPESTT